MQKPLPATAELEKNVDALDKRLSRLRSLYEQYFQGIERIEPSMERTNIKNILQEMRKHPSRNTAVRFRVNQLVARMHSYETYWTRVTRQMEEGTYQRDIFKARYRSSARTDKTNTEPSPRQEDVEPAGLEPSTHPSLPSPLPKGPTGRPTRAPTGLLSDKQINLLYDAYLKAKRSCKEPIHGLTKDAMASSLRKQVSSIQKQYRCKSVQFKVAIKKGKTVLQAVPKF